ncbi:ricin-type beta-trefoil lectin domain protein [Rugosimonospora acidiphila]|uniref:Ricin-type beta-trefoil lectin domain protein n=1 Tax=Rugosimonospora acidiphila TaxID=556531 RepID=A0ABP9SSC9_9ACTN
MFRLTIGAARRRTSWRLAAATAAACLVTTAAAVGVAGPATVALAATNQFKGVNWADPRDNYADDPVVPSGLSTSDSYATSYAKATAVIGGFQTNLGANTVRLPVNPYTVNGSFWSSYTGAIDAATAKGFNVILSYWEGVAHKDGQVDNLTSYWTMWQTVTSKYAGNGRVYFEPMNEPFGYSASAWANLVAQWMSTYPSIPKNRVFVSGTGYNDNVTSVCADSRFTGAYLSLHVYGFWNTSQTAYAGWVSDLRNRIGSCASRTVVDEWGAEMTTGLNYTGPINNNYFVAYVEADSDIMHALGMGSVYWPGLRTGDTYSMETLHGSGTALTLSNNNASGVTRLQWAWGGGGGGATVVRGTGSNRCLDVPGSTTTNGTQLDIWDCNGGGNQSWLLTPSKWLVVYGNKCLDVPGGASAPGTKAELWDCNGGTNQQWNVSGDGTITSVATGLCLDVAGAGTANHSEVDVYTCNGGSNQKWTRA